MNPEILEALRLVEEYDRRRPKLITEFRIYYDEEGRVTMYCETDHPADSNYIVIDNPDVFFILSIIIGVIAKFPDDNVRPAVIDGEISGA
jgi:hypothetical protein